MKAHKCEICTKKFALRKNMVTNFRTHFGEKPYYCAVYGKWFILVVINN